MPKVPSSAEQGKPPKQAKDGRKGMASGRTVTHNEAIRKIRALGMMKMRAEGATMEAVADTYQCNPKTVERTLSWAERAKIATQYEDRLLEDVVGPAIECVRGAIAGTTPKELRGDVKAALRVLEGVGLLKKGAERTAEKKIQAEGKQSDALTLEIYMLRREAQQLTGGGIQDGQLALPAEAGPDAQGVNAEKPEGEAVGGQ